MGSSRYLHWTPVPSPLPVSHRRASIDPYESPAQRILPQESRVEFSIFPERLKAGLCCRGQLSLEASFRPVSLMRPADRSVPMARWIHAAEYDLSEDPGESHNVADANPDSVRELSTKQRNIRDQGEQCVPNCVGIAPLCLNKNSRDGEHLCRDKNPCWLTCASGDPDQSRARHQTLRFLLATDLHGVGNTEGRACCECARRARNTMLLL